MAGHERGRGEVDLHDAVPDRHFHVGDGAVPVVPADAGGIDQIVEPRARVEGVCDGARDQRLVGGIALDVAPGGAVAFGKLGWLGLGVDGGHRAALGAERAGDGKPHAPARARHHAGLAGESFAHGAAPSLTG